MEKNNFKVSKAAKSIENNNVLRNRLNQQGSFENAKSPLYTTPRKTTIGGAAGPARPIENTNSIIYEKQPESYGETVKPASDNSIKQEIIRQDSFDTARKTAPVLPRYGSAENPHQESQPIGGAAGPARTIENTNSIIYEKQPESYGETVKPAADTSIKKEIIRQNSYDTARKTAPVLPRHKILGARIDTGARPQPRYGSAESHHRENEPIGGAAGSARTSDYTKSVIKEKQSNRFKDTVKPAADTSIKQEIIRQNSYDTARKTAPLLPRHEIPGARIRPGAGSQPRYGKVENSHKESQPIGGAAGSARTTDYTKSVIKEKQSNRFKDTVKPAADTSIKQEIIRKNSYETARKTAPVLPRHKIPGARIDTGEKPQLRHGSSESTGLSGRNIGGLAGGAKIPKSAAAVIHEAKTASSKEVIKPALDFALKEHIIKEPDILKIKLKNNQVHSPGKDKRNTEGLKRTILKDKKDTGTEFIKSSFADTVKDSIIKPSQSELYADRVWGIKENQENGAGVLKIIGGITAHHLETAGGLINDDNSLSSRARGLSAKYGYKAGKYAVQGGYSVARGAFRIGRYTDKLSLDVGNGVLSAKEARLQTLKRTGSSIAGSGGSIKKILKEEVVKGIEDFHGSDDLGMQALTMPKDVIVKTRRTMKAVSTTGKAVKKAGSGAVKGTKKVAHKTVEAVKYISGVIKKALSSPVVVKGALLVILAIVCAALLFAVITSITTIIPSISLKSNDKELAKTYEYITKLDADLSYEIRTIPDNHEDVDQFHFYMNGAESSAEGITIYTNADMMLLYFDCKYDDYAFDKLLHGFFGGTNIKDEVNTIHNTLYSYTTNKWKEEIRHRIRYRDENGRMRTETWIEIIIHLDINVSATSFNAYLMDNINTLLTLDEQERMETMQGVGIYTSKVCLGSPFKEEGYFISTRWGWRIDPFSGMVAKHEGIDIPKPEGTPINNVMYGEVKAVGHRANYGNYVIVEWGKNAVIYGHMSSVEVSRGQEVKKGDIIGYVGSTGQAQNSSLYLEYYIEDGFNTNPAFYLTGASYTGGTGSTDIVLVAASQLGNVGGQPYWSWYGFGGRVEWCACFVSWCANECGYIESGVIPKFSACARGVNWFKEQGLWQPSNTGYIPQAGDIIFFDFDRVGVSHHVGIVESSDGSVVKTIEGNSGDACRQRTYSLNNGAIIGYGTPMY